MSSLEGKQSLTEEFTKESLVALFGNSKGVYWLHTRGRQSLKIP
ncbi:hypothetical protein [Helicobacter marmotae]|nr:hypothetical protein [Helicobacter marmotae]